MEIHLKEQGVYKWRSDNGLHIKGTFNHSGNTSELFEDMDGRRFEQLLEGSKEFFAFIFCNEDYIIAAVDHLRMFPLFYGEQNGRFFLSDDAYWVQKKTLDLDLDPSSLTEFIMTGYVTGRDTLSPNVKQLQAGEYLIYNRKTQEITIRNYHVVHETKDSQFEKETALKELDRIHVNVFKRLLNSLDGRTAVVPLSAGYDSRIIVMMLKRLGYEKVICFTYGKPGNWEAKISQDIAETLGYKWIFIPYSSEKWKAWFESEARRDFMEFANELTSLTHIQDHLAVYELKNKGLIPEDSVIIPGHTAMLAFSGFAPNYHHLEQAAADLFRKHYSLWNWSYKDARKFKEDLMKKTADLLNSNRDHGNSIEDAIYLWEMRERHAKFICNSVRAYEHLGYEWRLPLWEKDMVDFWLKTPQHHRVGKQLYKEYYDWKFGNKTLNIQKPNNEGTKSASLRGKAKEYKKIYSFFKKIYHGFKRFSEARAYYKHPLDWYKIISYRQYLKGYMNGAANINSYVVEQQLRLMKHNKESPSRNK